MLHVLRTVGETGWLVSQKVLSLLWLAVLAPGYYPDPCVCCLFLWTKETAASGLCSSNCAYAVAFGS